MTSVTIFKTKSGSMHMIPSCTFSPTKITTDGISLWRHGKINGKGDII